MAGIGFELKKLFSRKGFLASLRAYGYAGIVCTGPMLLGIALLLGLRFVASLRGANLLDEDLLSTMITYTLLASLLASSVLAMTTTRYTADMMYRNELAKVLPSFFGSVSVILIFGSALYYVFLVQAGISPLQQALCLALFGELSVVWMQINYLSAIKNYRSILVTFALGVFLSLLTGAALLLLLRAPVLESLFASVVIGYGCMMVGFFGAMYRYYPRGEGGAFAFLPWIDRYPQLPLLNLCLTIGLFSHLVVNWFGPAGRQVQGLFFCAPSYDIPALAAFLVVLPATVNFVTSVEVNFYPTYRRYYALFNEGGSMRDIEQAEDEMMIVLRHEMSYLSFKQLITALLFIALLGPLLHEVGLLSGNAMMGTFQFLCIAYSLYAVANSLLLIQLYFADNAGALLSAFVFMSVSTGVSVAMVDRSTFSGMGLFIASAAMYLVAWIRLARYTKKLQVNILCAQPVLAKVNAGFFTALFHRLQNTTVKGSKS